MNIKIIGKVLVKYAPQILAGISAGATVGAVVSAADVGFKQGRKSEDECKITDWTVPATLTVIAVATNLASATLGYKRQMSVIAAYAALEKKFQNYKNDVADMAPEVDDLITHEHIMQQKKEREEKIKNNDCNKCEDYKKLKNKINDLENQIKEKTAIRKYVAVLTGVLKDDAIELLKNTDNII